MSYQQRPGLVTDEYLPFGGSGLDYPQMVRAGFEWVSYLTYNPELWRGTKDYDLGGVKAHGFKVVGVWGVIYTRDDFYNGAKTTARHAVDLGAQCLQINCEEIYKETRPNRLGKAIIKGARDGGWSGPVDLITYGAPWSPLVNDYNMDEQSFLETGGAIIPEAYYNESEGYEPALCKQYMDRLKIPAAQTNYMLGLYQGRRGKIVGAAQVDLLEKAKIGANFSIYMLQHLTQSDVTPLAAFIKKQAVQPKPPTPTPEGPTSTEQRKKVVVAAAAWEKTQPDYTPRARLTISRRICGDSSTDTRWNSVRDGIQKLLDDAGFAK